MLHRPHISFRRTSGCCTASGLAYVSTLDTATHLVFVRTLGTVVGVAFAKPLDAVRTVTSAAGLGIVIGIVFVSCMDAVPCVALVGRVGIVSALVFVTFMDAVPTVTSASWLGTHPGTPGPAPSIPPGGYPVKSGIPVAAYTGGTGYNRDLFPAFAQGIQVTSQSGQRILLPVAGLPGFPQFQQSLGSFFTLSMASLPGRSAGQAGSGHTPRPSRPPR